MYCVIPELLDDIISKFENKKDAWTSWDTSLQLNAIERLKIVRISQHVISNQIRVLLGHKVTDLDIVKSTIWEATMACNYWKMFLWIVNDIKNKKLNIIDIEINEYIDTIDAPNCVPSSQIGCGSMVITDGWGAYGEASSSLRFGKSGSNHLWMTFSDPNDKREHLRKIGHTDQTGMFNDENK
eukprot:77610_1